MREHEMRMRVERVLQACGRRALVPALGVGLTIGGCATGRSAVRPGPPIAAKPVGDQTVSIYSAQVPWERAERLPPEPKLEPDSEFDPTLDLP